MKCYVVMYKDNDGLPSEKWFSGKVFSTKEAAQLYCDERNHPHHETVFFIAIGEFYQNNTN